MRFTLLCSLLAYKSILRIFGAVRETWAGDKLESQGGRLSGASCNQKPPNTA